jgi:selenoprotein W-related protein
VTLPGGTVGRHDRDVTGPRIVITYCTQCKWLLRASWYAGELLQTFHEELAEVALAPATGGTFRIDLRIDGRDESLWNRKRDGGFPEITELKKRVRDLVAPDRPLGHVDAAHHGPVSGEAGAEPSD